MQFRVKGRGGDCVDLYQLSTIDARFDPFPFSSELKEKGRLRERLEMTLSEGLQLVPGPVCGDHTRPAFRCVRVREHISLLPCYVGNISQGVIGQLNAKVLTFSSRLNGVMLSYSKPVLLQKEGRILDEQPHIHFDLSYTAYVFRPLLGSTLHGVVNKIGTDHVGCLLYDCFNVSIVNTGNKVHHEKSGHSSSHQELEVGVEIRFKVVAIDTPVSGGVMSLVGELEPKKHKKSGHRKRKRPPEKD